MENERKPVEEMSIDEKLTEVLILLRAGADAVESAMGNPVVAGMIGAPTDPMTVLNSRR